MSGVLKGEIALEQGKTQDLSALFSDMSAALGTASKEESGRVGELFQKAVQSGQKTEAYARIAALAVALVLICVFAIGSILRM